MEPIKYQDVVVRFGDHRAYKVLLTLEKVARIHSEIVHSEEELRFKKALEALNEINFAA